MKRRQKEDKREHRTNGTNRKQIVRWLDLNPNKPEITLSLIVLCAPGKRQRPSDWKTTMTMIYMLLSYMERL